MISFFRVFAFIATNPGCNAGTKKNAGEFNLKSLGHRGK